MEQNGQGPSGSTRRRALRAAGYLGTGGLLSAGVLGSVPDTDDSSGTRSEPTQTEDTYLDYGEFDRWSDIYWRSAGDRGDISLVPCQTNTGSSSLQVHVQAGEHWGIDTHYRLDPSGFELTGRVTFALRDGWRMDGREQAACRLWNCAMSLGEGSAGGGVPDGTNGWSNRLYVTNWHADPDGPFHLLSYSYHMDRIYDSDYLLDGEQYALAHPEIVPGEWYEFEYTVRVNTVDEGQANADGAVTYWLDGDRIYDRRDFRFTEDRDTNGIETNGPAMHYGGKYTAPNPLTVYYADHSMKAWSGPPRDTCPDQVNSR